MRERILTHTAQRTVFSRNRSKTPRLEGGAARGVGDFKDVGRVTESRRFADGDASLPSHNERGPERARGADRPDRGNDRRHQRRCRTTAI